MTLDEKKERRRRVAMEYAAGTQTQILVAKYRIHSSLVPRIAREFGVPVRPRGGPNGAKLTAGERTAIREAPPDTSRKDLAARFGVCVRTIALVRHAA